MKLMSAFGLVSLVALGLATSAQPSNAMVIYPWCANYGGRMGGSQNCGFTGLRQSQATRAGNGGSVFPTRGISPIRHRRAMHRRCGDRADRDAVVHRRARQPPRSDNADRGGPCA